MTTIIKNSTDFQKLTVEPYKVSLKHDNPESNIHHLCNIAFLLFKDQHGIV